MEQHLDGLVGVQRLVDLDARIGGIERHPEQAVVRGAVLAGFRAVMRRQQDEERARGRIDVRVDQPHAHGVGHHHREDAVTGKGRHRAEAARERVAGHGHAHHRHILLGDAEADAAAERVIGAHQPADLLGFAGQDRLGQVARADIEKRRLPHHPLEPRLGGFARGHARAFFEDQFRRQHIRSPDRGVVGQRPIAKRAVHQLDQRRLGRNARAGDIEARVEVFRFGCAQPGQHGLDVGGRVPFLGRDGKAQRLHDLDVFGVRERRAVRVRGSFQPAVVDALHGVAQDHRGAPVAEALHGLGVGVYQFADVVSAGLDHVPAEGAPVAQVGDRQHFSDRAVNAVIVIVQSHDEIGQAEPRGQVARFVAHALFGLGIAADHEDLGRQPARALERREAQAHRETVSRRSGGNVGQREFRFHVAPGPRVAAETRQILRVLSRGACVFREHHAAPAQSLVDQRYQGVEQRRAMAGRPDQAVAPGVLGARGVEAENAGGDERQHHFGLGRGAAGMARFGAIHRREGQPAHDARQPCNLLFVDAVQRCQIGSAQIQVHRAFRRGKRAPARGRLRHFQRARRGAIQISHGHVCLPAPILYGPDPPPDATGPIC